MAVGTSTNLECGADCKIGIVARGAVFAILISNLTTISLARDTLSATADIESLDRVQEIAATLDDRPAGLGPNISDRAAWERLKSLPQFANVVAVAQRVAETPLPAQSDELFLDFSRTGNRDRWQGVAFFRRKCVNTLALAECLENRGRFLPLLEDLIRQICAEKTWVWPAHDAKLDNFEGRQTMPDLGATTLAMELAEVRWLLQDKLSTDIRDTIDQNVKRRVLDPVLACIRNDDNNVGWLRMTNNWNSVCLSGTTVAALATLESPQERAAFVAAAERFIQSFLAGFTSDGYCAEGVGYWNYGFGRFILLSEAVRQATCGEVDLVACDQARLPALFCLRSEIVSGVYVTVSDCDPGTCPASELTDYVCRRYRIESKMTDRGTQAAARGDCLAMTMMLVSLSQSLPNIPAPSTEESSRRTCFPEGGLWICRAGNGSGADFGVAIKGGHNNETHNHNDVGSFSVVLGRRMVVCDPGREVYTRRTFSADRYKSALLNSFGHNVPLVAGKMQTTGEAARAKVLSTEFSNARDVVKFDLSSAYAVPALKSLERTFTFERESKPSLTIHDEAVFASSTAFETALVTWGHWRQTGGASLRITDHEETINVEIDGHGSPITMSDTVIDEVTPSKSKPTRISIAFREPTSRAVLTLRVAALPND